MAPHDSITTAYAKVIRIIEVVGIPDGCWTNGAVVVSLEAPTTQPDNELPAV